jgi:hypothetical protein
MPNEIRGDPVQPRPHRPRRIEAIPAPERDGQGLGGELVRERCAEPPREVAVEGREFRLEGVLERAPHANQFPAATASVPGERAAQLNVSR